MVKPRSPDEVLRRELRLTGTRETPDLPVLERSDFSVGVWDAVNEPYWTIGDAAFYVHGRTPSDLLNAAENKEIERTRFWLIKEFKDYRGLPCSTETACTPGDVMRFLWESRRKFSLKVWTLYRFVDTGHIDFRIENHILAARYVAAAKIVWRRFEKASVSEVVEFLMTLPYSTKDAKGLPIFASRHTETLKDYIKPHARLEPGRRPSSERVTISENKDELLEIIQKEIGY